ncbi:MAG TPA: hypothetical protein V6D06_06680, partial [Trichocoleus sp.]
PYTKPAGNASQSRQAPIQRLLEALLNTLAPSQQPRVSCFERHGQTFWSVYDPISRKTEQLDSEEAVRIWLERRYYQG